MSAHHCHRWTISQLASLQPTTESTIHMLQEVAARLERQTTTIHSLLQHQKALPSTSNNKTIEQQLSFLHHVHQDTALNCRHEFQRQHIWATRWSAADQRHVRQCLEQVRDRHAPSLERWVDVAMALHRQQSSSQESLLEDLLQGRLSIQLLTHHYSLLSHELPHRRRPTGAITLDQSLWDMVKDAYTEANFLCHAHYQCAPAMQIENNHEALSVTVVRPWLSHILVEVIKNGMSATVQRDQHEKAAVKSKESGKGVLPDDDDTVDSLPPLLISAVQQGGATILTIRDFGVGLPDTGSNKSNNNNNGHSWDPFGWGTSSAKQRFDRLKIQQSYAAVRPPLASLGVGLPTSRAMLRHFGGDLELLPAPATREETSTTGTVAKLTLPHDTNIPEALPPHFLNSEE